jgi:hypothetical protein
MAGYNFQNIPYKNTKISTSFENRVANVAVIDYHAKKCLANISEDDGAEFTRELTILNFYNNLSIPQGK